MTSPRHGEGIQHRADVATERAILGSVLRDCQTVPGLNPEHFTNERLRRIYATARRLEERDGLTLPELRLAVGDDVQPSFLASLTSEAPPTRHLQQFVDRLQQLARVRAALGEADAFQLAVLSGETARAEEHLDAMRDAIAGRDRIEPEDLLLRMDHVEAAEPVYLAGGIVRENGVHLWWGPPGGYKTYTCILLVLEMTQRAKDELLFGVASLTILRPWRRVLWLGDEESAAEWKWRAENIARGHGLRPPGAEILFADASGGSALLTTDNLGQLLDAAGPGVDAVFLDPLPNLLPTATHHDGDPNPSALARVCRPLRRLAKTRGVAIYLLTHPNASGQRERGATAYRGSADVTVELRFEAGTLTLLDLKNRDADKATLSFRPEWAREDGALSLRFAPTDTPAESCLRHLSPCARAMYSAANTGAGRITYAELMRTPYPAKGKTDVSLRTKQRAWSELRKADLVTDVGGVVQLLDAGDADSDDNGAST